MTVGECGNVWVCMGSVWQCAVCLWCVCLSVCSCVSVVCGFAVVCVFEEGCTNYFTIYYLEEVGEQFKVEGQV